MILTRHGTGWAPAPVWMQEGREKLCLLGTDPSSLSHSIV